MERRRGLLVWLRAHAVEVALVAGALAVHLYVALTPVHSLLNWFHIDDSFYYFKTAANIAQGLGSTFDGLGRTNGYHPLWMLMLIPLFTFYRLDGILPLRLVVVMQGLLNAGMGVLVYRTARRALLPWTAAGLAFLWSLWPTFFNLVTISGLETTLEMFFVALVWNRAVALREEDRLEDARAVRTLGWAAGLMLLARLDTVFLAAAVGLWLLGVWGRRCWQDASPWAARLRRVFPLALAYGLPIVALLGGYLLWNRLYIGHWMPISGEVKHWWGARGDTIYGIPPTHPYQVLKRIFLKPDGPWGLAYRLVAGVRDGLAAHLGKPFGRLRWVLLLLGGLSLLPWRQQSRAHRRLLTLVLLAGMSLHTTYYEVSYYVGMRDWYWVGETFVTLLILVVLVDGYGRLLLRGRRRRVQAVLTVVVVGGVLGQSLRYVPRRYPCVRPAGEPAHYYLHRTAWVEAHTPPGALIGATGAGSLGYFIHDRTVFPLDGLINSYEYLAALQQGRAPAYLTAVGLDYVVGKGWLLNLQPYAPIFHGRLKEVAHYQYEPSMGMEFLWRFTPEAP